MRKSGVVATVVLLVMIIGLLAAPSHFGAGSPSVARGAAPQPYSAAPATVSHFAPAAVAPLTGYHRTVLVETFTAEWCVYCEEESQALYSIDHSNSANVLTIGELHVCYSPSSCGDNYPTPDGTADVRATYYSVTGFPTVYFDGGHAVVGASGTTSQLEATYLSQITAASAVPGNVSIDQSASIATGSTLAFQAGVTSSITGTYHAVTYLVEYIGKNDSTGHDLGNVVRRSIIDQNVNLIAGNSVQLQTTVPVLSTWNTQHLGVITFLQDNTTSIVENANYAPVVTMTTALAGNVTSVVGGNTMTVTVTATNSSTGSAVAGALVTLSSNAGGAFAPDSGMTAADGTFSSVFTAPLVPNQQTVTIAAQVQLAGYVTNEPSTSVVVIPIGPPSAPTGVALAPWNSNVQVSWNAVVVTGGGTVAYHVYRATSAAGPFSQVSVTLSTNYIDSALVSSQSYWYTVAAQTTVGFSQNSSVIVASAVVGTPDGLPANVGWWLSIDSATLSSPSSNGALAVHLPDGSYDYSYGAYSYAYVTTELTSTVTVASGTVQFSPTFSPRYATLHGTVTPVNANVTVDGTALPVVGGSFEDTLVAGTYTVVVTSPGYHSNTSTVALTPGNTTTVFVPLTKIATSGGGGSSATLGGLSGLEITALIVLTGAVALAAVVGVMLRARRRSSGGRQATPEPSDESPSEP